MGPSFLTDHPHGGRLVDGISSVENGVVPAGDAIDVQVDRVKASLEGVDPDALSKQLNDLLAATTLQLDREAIETLDAASDGT